ncbi:MAG TPA: RNA polymerase sigma factor [Tenuifilaceae bacterium]|nr:RNA polymerase sigma factor [Tenuifilaceae bacterium]HPJ46832.1 RNA polymerase sigma factor [Tenuifilaceae bacterium]HPQ35242.1 RNA polymerase sigma factor [Tenuifilaceae bacterium]HRX69331.1 RNA polymerase sigma factor [Tenuifilaceae bacterium]
MVWTNRKLNDLTDIQLIEGCLSGKSRFQELLYRRYFSFAMSICVRYTKTPDDAMEVVNDSYLKMFDSLKSFDKSKPFKSWFARILVNTAIDDFRKSKKFNSHFAMDVMPDSDSQEPEIDQELNAEDIISLFSQLPDNLRITFNLHEIEGYSHQEIANMLGIETSSSRANLTRAKSMLRNLYSKNVTTESYNE